MSCDSWSTLHSQTWQMMAWANVTVVNYAAIHCSPTVTWWCNGWSIGLTIKRSRFEFQPPLSCNGPLQVDHTHVHLSPSSIIWYRPNGNDVVQLQRTIGLLSHWPCITRLNGIPICGLNGLKKGDEHPTCAPERWAPHLCSSRVQHLYLYTTYPSR